MRQEAQPPRRQAQTASLNFSRRLHERRAELERLILTRVRAIEPARSVTDPVYAEGLTAAVGAGVGYALEVLEGPVHPGEPVPLELLAQARLACRNGVTLDVVLRRYLAGLALLTDCVMTEAEETDGIDVRGLQELGRRQAVLLDEVVAAISEEYRREARARSTSASERRAEAVVRLLAGETVDVDALGYELGTHHLAAIAIGGGAPAALRRIAERLDRRILVVDRGEGQVWAWFGGRPVEPGLAIRYAAEEWSGPLAIGEPDQGIEGWRLSHKQAAAAFPLARAQGGPLRYADVALLACAAADEVLVDSLRELYLVPLSAARGGGEVLRRTALAYFQTQRNVSSAAAALGVSRKTVAARLRAIEERLDTPIDRCAGALETALRLQQIGHL